MSPFEDLRGVAASVSGDEEEPLIAVEDAEEGMFESLETEVNDSPPAGGILH